MKDVAEVPRYGATAARGAAALIRETLGSRATAPVAAIVLGSGLGGLTRRIANATAIPFADVPGFPTATVQGHAGQLVVGTLSERPVIALAGRFHLYEGHPPELSAYPIRVMHALGARTLIVSNAAGGVRRSFQAGDLMVIDDHLNLMGRSPLVGPSQPGEDRFPDMSEPYDRQLIAQLRAAALDLGVPLTEGVYAGLLGPTYETRAEVRMLERLGADAVGMSTVPEVLVARLLGMRVVGVSCITNMACGLSPAALSHEEVLESAERVGQRFELLIEKFVSVLDLPRA